MHVRRRPLYILLVGILLLAVGILLLPFNNPLWHYMPYQNHPDTTQHEPSSENNNGLAGISSPMLRARLDVFLGAPALSYSEAVTMNEKNCFRDTAEKQVNQDQLKANREFWSSITQTDIRNRREDIVRYLGTLEKQGIAVTGDNPNVGLGTRGIVMTAGNKNTMRSAVAIIKLIKRVYQSTLPVEIFSFPGEIEDPKTLQEELRVLDATHHELLDLHRDKQAWKNFHLKAAAMIASSFSEVLYLDSDNFPLRDPEYLFDAPPYREGGSVLFWPDYNKDHPDNAIWRILGRKCEYHEWQVESGQILIDKRGNAGLNLAALYIASHMQIDRDFWFRLSGGDKDTFKYACWVLGAKYAFAPRWLSSLGTMDYSEDTFCGYAMLQNDILKNEQGQYPPLFVHANLLKHRSLAWTYQTRTFFQSIKRFKYDNISERSLDRARVWVYDELGMCVDIRLDDSQGSQGEQEITLEDFNEIFGEAFKDFENQWRDVGGSVGGF